MSKLKIPFLISAHLLFWILSYIFITQSEISWSGFDNVNGGLPIAYGYGLFFNACIFYIQVFWLVPKYFIQHKNKRFWVNTILLLAVVTIIETLFDLQLADTLELDSIKKEHPEDLFFIFLFLNTLAHLFYSLVGFLYRFQFEYFKSEKSKSNLLLETREAELKYLRAQLNPHFLFNAINSVYHLIGKDDPKAKKTLLQFSDLLRYQLYESNTKYISVIKELENLKQYIKIEGVRKGEDISLSYAINYDNSQKQIVPLLLIPFIENAFKHCSNHSKSSDNVIDISIEEDENMLILKVNNSYDIKPTNEVAGGLGLKNVKRRLALLYPSHHQLDITTQNGLFSVHLELHL
ncbi:MAG: histidine kinase [Psychroserpens sp.]|uniref:sensor histidine kinase n=1 Tax=Psychroserpens sp. TaxID=2020870 RepID=UPI003002E9E7